jgi:1-acyl-sn-glycerol-3-phosphate acyltransferase
VATVAARLYAGHTVVAFPEGTTWCGRSGDSHQGAGPFYPAMFQAAVDTGRPVQPLRLRYQHRDGRVSTIPAYIGDDTVLRSIGRLMVARRTVARIYVESLQLPGNDRRDLARRCQAAIRTSPIPRSGHGRRSSVLAS